MKTYVIDTKNSISSKITKTSITKYEIAELLGVDKNEVFNILELVFFENRISELIFDKDEDDLIALLKDTYEGYKIIKSRRNVKQNSL